MMPNRNSIILLLNLALRSSVRTESPSWLKRCELITDFGYSLDLPKHLLREDQLHKRRNAPKESEILPPLKNKRHSISLLNYIGLVEGRKMKFRMRRWLFLQQALSSQSLLIASRPITLMAHLVRAVLLLPM